MLVRTTQHLRTRSLRLAVASAAVLSLIPSPSSGQKPTETIQIKIDANEWNRRALLEKLNDHGAKSNWIFVLDEKYKYLIHFETGKTERAVIVKGTGGTRGYDAGFATVCDDHDNELFRITKESGFGEAKVTDHAARDHQTSAENVPT